MEQLGLTREEMVNASRDEFATEDRLQRLAAVFPTWRLLAEGHPVSPEQVASAVKRPLDEVKRDLGKVEEFGFYGTNDQGNINNFFGLKVYETTHRLLMNGTELYAGCAIDSLFVPAFVGKTADVTSRCPISGTEIRLTVTPDGVTSLDPASTLISVLVPGTSPEGPT